MSDNRITLTDLHKLRRDGSKIAMLTCYDASFATLLENAGVESLLVGDSLGNVLQGHDTTLPVTLADMLMQYIEMARVVSPGNPLSDSGGEHGLYSTEYSQVQGIKVLNSTALELFTTGTFFPDANYAAIGVIADVASPLGYSGYTDGFGMTPWQIYAE